jgi:esterase
MQTLSTNGYDMAYLELGSGSPLVLVHGTLGDFRTWNSVMGPLSKKHRVISVSLRRFFPEHWDGVGNDYLMAQHVSDVIGFIVQLKFGPVDLMGHSRGGHIGFRVAEQRPDLLRRLVLAEPGGDLDATLRPDGGTPSGHTPVGARIPVAAEHVRNGDIDGALQLIIDMIDGEGTWKRLPAAPKQQLRDNAYTLIGQVGENRRPFSRVEAESIKTPTLLIGGGDTPGSLAQIWRVLAQHIPGAKTAVIPGARHWIFDSAPQGFSEAVMEFLAA